MLDAYYLMTVFGLVGLFTAIVMIFVSWETLREEYPGIVAIVVGILLLIFGLVAVFMSWDEESSAVETYDTKELMELSALEFPADETNGKYLLESNGEKDHFYFLAIPKAEDSMMGKYLKIASRRLVVEDLGEDESPYIEYRHASSSHWKMFRHKVQEYTSDEFVVHVSPDQILQDDGDIPWRDLTYSKYE